MYQISDKPAAIRSLQTILGLHATGFYNEKTKKYVAEHQAEYNLDVNGIVDYQTFTSILKKKKLHDLKNPEYAKTLISGSLPFKPGDYNSDISLINSLLKEIAEDYKFESKSPTGSYYGADTSKAVYNIRSIFSLTQKDEIDTELFNRILMETKAIKLKNNLL